MSLTKENKKGRKEVREYIARSEVLGHIPEFPIRVIFSDESKMDGMWATCELKGKGSKKYFEIAFESALMTSPHGRDFCISMIPHELAHVHTWSSSKKVEQARQAKYGDHGPDFGVMYSQLWHDLMEGPCLTAEREDDDDEE